MKNASICTMKSHLHSPDNDFTEPFQLRGKKSYHKPAWRTRGCIIGRPGTWIFVQLNRISIVPLGLYAKVAKCDSIELETYWWTIREEYFVRWRWLLELNIVSRDWLAVLVPLFQVFNNAYGWEMNYSCDYNGLLIIVLEHWRDI